MMLTECRHFMKKLVPAMLVVMFCATPSAVLSIEGQEPAIIDAAHDGDTSKLRSLIEAGADVNARDDNGVTPLMWAVRESHDNVAKILIEAGVRE